MSNIQNDKNKTTDMLKHEFTQSQSFKNEYLIISSQNRGALAEKMTTLWKL